VSDAAQALRSFLHLHYGAGTGADAAMRQAAEKIANVLLDLLLRLDFRPPAEQERLYPNDKLYALNYQRCGPATRAAGPG
jgi:hypothetical protein